MTRQTRTILVAIAAFAVGALAIGLFLGPVRLAATLSGQGPGRSETYQVDRTDYTPPKEDDSLLVDDRLEDKKTAFDPALVDRRPLGDWSLNASEAVIRLDVPILKPDLNPERLALHPSYTAAIRQAKGHGVVLPSVNMIDGKAKQFDDGLYAAIDQAYYLGHGPTMKGHLDVLRRIADKVEKGSLTADYLLAGLSLGEESSVALSPWAITLVGDFLGRPIQSKPIGVYTWTPPLSACFKVLRYFARPIPGQEIPAEIARVLRDDEALRLDYATAIGFYGKLSNPLVGLSPLDYLKGTPAPTVPPKRVSLFPASTSRETELFDKLFPEGLPPDANLMNELIKAIRSGKVDLKPRADGGWYEYQVYALETLLLPEQGAESDKLLLTKTYKKRMLEAFKALVTKRRETHVRQLDVKSAPTAMVRPLQDLTSVKPRLRVEPNPTYYLRTARSYAFLATFLDATLGQEALTSLHGLREGGLREPDLRAELATMRTLFYGLYLLSAEDIGLKPALLDGEAVDRDAAEALALGWLERLATDPDLSADTRVAVPVYFDARTNAARLWMTLGVRLTALDARYARSPQVRPLDGSADWKAVEAYKLAPVEYLIPVDEFAEVEIPGGNIPNRAELRALCDRFQTKDKIIETLRKSK